MRMTRLPLQAVLTRVFTFGLGLALFFEQAGARQLLDLEGANGLGLMTPVYWVSLLAPVFFLGALWAASGVFVRIDRGEDFAPAVVSGLREIGTLLMLGAFAAIVVQPSLIFLMANGFTAMRGVRFALNVENVTLAVMGLVLLTLARRGRALRAKLDGFV